MYIVNGEILENAKLNLDDGFFFGHGVFETILLKEDKPILLDKHLERLNNSLKKFFIDKKVEEEYIISIIKRWNFRNCALKIVVSSENIIVENREVLYKEEQYKEGFLLKIGDMRRNPYSHTTYIKSLNYYDNIIEKRKSKEEGYDEVIFLNTENKLAEGATTNLFFIKDKKICTPSIQCGILPGVVRNYLIHNLKEMYTLEEGVYTLEDLFSSNGVFLTNSLLGVMKVKSIEGRLIRDNSKVDKIRELYMKSLGL